MDEHGIAGSAHELLLGVAGRIDDDLLALARELVAVGEVAHALALVAAGLAADRVVLPEPVRAELVAATREARTDLDAGAALAPAGDPADGHVFSGSAPGDEALLAAAHALPTRLLDGATVRLAWRRTPAGAAPGPLPHPVLLVEVEAGGRPLDVLAYQLAVALERAAGPVSVEVLAVGAPVPAYHAAALRASVLVDDGFREGADAHPLAAFSEPTPSRRAADLLGGPAAEPQPAPVSPAEVPPLSEASAPEVVPAAGHVGTIPTEAPGSEATDLAQHDPAAGTAPADAPQEPESHTAEPPAPRPLPMRARRAGPTEDEADSLAPLPSPVPVARRRPPHPETVDGEPAAAFADTPTFAAMQDPLLGLLRQPLLDPVLDPSRTGEPPEAAEPDWASEWASGSWALSDASRDDSGDRPPASDGPDTGDRPRDDRPRDDRSRDDRSRDDRPGDDLPGDEPVRDEPVHDEPIGSKPAGDEPVDDEPAPRPPAAPMAGLPARHRRPGPDEHAGPAARDEEPPGAHAAPAETPLFEPLQPEPPADPNEQTLRLDLSALRADRTPRPAPRPHPERMPAPRPTPDRPRLSEAERELLARLQSGLVNGRTRSNGTAREGHADPDA